MSTSLDSARPFESIYDLPGMAFWTYVNFAIDVCCFLGLKFLIDRILMKNRIVHYSEGLCSNIDRMTSLLYQSQPQIFALKVS